MSLAGGVAFLREWWLWLLGEALSLIAVPISGAVMPVLTFWHVFGVLLLGLGAGIYFMLAASNFQAKPDAPLEYAFSRYWKSRGKPSGWHPYMEEGSGRIGHVDWWFEHVMDAISLGEIRTWGRYVANNNPGDRFRPALREITTDEWRPHAYAGFRYALPNDAEVNKNKIIEGGKTYWEDVRVSRAQVNHLYPIRLRDAPKRTMRWIMQKLNLKSS